jgi:hypothetical protein
MLLTANLIAFYEFEEVSGTRYDQVGSYNLTTSASNPTYGAGVSGNAVRFQKDLSEYLYRADTIFQTGDIDFSFVTWVKLTATTAYYGVITKWGGSAATNDYVLWYYHDVGKYEMDVERGDEGGLISVLSDVVSAPTDWNMIACGHDSVNNNIWISINAGTALTTSITQGVNATTTNFTFGKNDGVDYMDGDIDQTGFWKRKLNATEITWLYNAGSGRSYAAIVAAGDISGSFNAAWARGANQVIV